MKTGHRVMACFICKTLDALDQKPSHESVRAK